MLFDNVHFISESLGYSLEHISDVRGNCIENSGLLVGGHISGNVKEFDSLLLSINFLSLNDLDSKVLEGLGDGSSLSLYNDDSGFNTDID